MSPGARCAGMYDVRLSAKAQDFYRKADKPLATKLARCFEQLEREPRHHPNAKPLKGALALPHRRTSSGGASAENRASQ